MALWRKAIEQKAEGLGWRRTRRIARAHVKRSRRHWQQAVRMLQAA
jgi:hypothetical protein